MAFSTGAALFGTKIGRLIKRLQIRYGIGTYVSYDACRLIVVGVGQWTGTGVCTRTEHCKAYPRPEKYNNKERKVELRENGWVLSLPYD